jgi:hypothetical protein
VALRFLLVTAAFVSVGSSIWACLPLLRVVAGMLCDGRCGARYQVVLDD